MMSTLTESEVKLVRKMERADRHRSLYYILCIPIAVGGLILVVLGVLRNREAAILKGALALLLFEYIILSLRTNSKHYGIIKQLLKQIPQGDQSEHADNAGGRKTQSQA